MKDSVTRFNFDDAFKALDEIEIPVAEKGIRANRVDLKESMKRVDKFELLFEDFYDVNNADDMNAVSEEREAEVAKAKLARIEKIVDLDAETEEDILPSYVGKTIIQCPQCMTLFYKNAEDIVRDEENPDVVNVNEVCQHCGNESGYDVVGKVAEETEAAPGDELGTDDFSAEVGDGENDIAIDDGSETTEEVPAEEGGEVDELSAEADLDSLDLDAELDTEEEPVEEEEANESLNTSELLKKIEDKNELKTENESEKLTLNEAVVEKETDQVCSVIANGKEDTEYFTGTEEECKAWIEEQNKTDAGKLRKWSVKKSAHVPVVENLELESRSKQLNDLATAIHKAFEAKNLSNIGVSTAASKCKWGSGHHIMITSSDNETDRNAEILKQFALKVLEKAGCKAEIAKIERANGATFIILDNILAAQQTAVAIKEGIEDNLDDKLKAHEDYIKYLRDTITEEEKKLANTKNEQVKQAIQKSIDAHREELEAALPDAVKAEAQAEDLPDATEAGMEDATDNASDETEETTESLHESVESMTDTLNRAWEVAKKTNSPIGVTVVTPVGAGTNSKIKEWSRSVNANLYYVDAKNPDLMVTGFDEKMISRPDTIIVIDEFDRARADAQKAISDEIDNLDTQVEMVIAISNDSNTNGDNFKRFKQYVVTVEKETATESLTEDVSMTSSPENFKTLLGTKEFKKPISQEEVESYFESITEETDTDILVEAGGFIDRGRLLTVAKAGKYPLLVTMPFLNPKDIKAANVATDKTIAQCPVTNKDYIKYYELNIDNEDKKADKEKFTQAQKDAKALGKTKLTIKNYKMADGTPKVVDNASIQQVNFYLAREEVGPKDLLAAATSIQNGNKVLYIGTYKAYSGTLDLSPLEQLNKSAKGMSFAEIEDEEEATPVEVDEKPITGTGDETPVEVDDDKKEKPVEVSDDSDSTTIGEVINKLAESGVELYITIIRNGTDNKGQYYTKNFTKIVKDLDITALQTKAKDLSGNGMGNDYSIIVVKKSKLDKLGTIVDFTDLDKITLFRYNNGTETANFSKVSTAKEDLEKLTEEFDFSVEEIDEESFNEKLTESLTKVYENVKSFEMTNCINQNTQLIVEGLVTFNSGKTRTTSYTFDLSSINEAVIKGTNTELFESCTINLNTKVINETLYADKLNYKYTIQGNLVEGFIKNK